jgi:hypothetical protein
VTASALDPVLRPIRWLVLGALILGCSACDLAPKSGGSRSAGPVVRDGASSNVMYINPFEPQRVRVHGLTALTTVNGEPRIDIHLELYDAYGHPVKALGTFVFQLYAGTTAEGDLQEQLRRWIVDLSDPEINASAYDRVTRTYRAALTGAPPVETSRGYVLEVQFRSPGGASLTARHPL